MKRLAALLDSSLAATLADEDADCPVGQLTWDVRQVAGPALVAVWRGKVHDGHDFLAEAKARGAVCALVERRVPEVALLQLVVDAPRRALARAARRFYDAPDDALATVGITGTNGKTTCAQLVASILAAHRGRAASVGTLGALAYGAPLPAGLPPVQLTTPEGPALCAILRALGDAGFAGAALEASSVALAQGRLDGVSFDVAAWTNLSQDHLDEHGTMAAYGAAKARLFAERLKPGGAVVQNGADAASLAAAAPALRGLGRAVRRYLFYPDGPPHAFDRVARGKTGQGAAHEVAVWAEDVRTGRDGTALTVCTVELRFGLQTPLVGAFNLENVLLATSCALALDIAPEAIQRGLARFAGVPGRLERVAPPEGAEGAPLVLVDYAHTPEALRRVLATVRALTPGRVWCVFGCGGDRDPNKRAPMGRAVGEGADVAVLTSDNPRSEAPEAIATATAQGLLAAGCRRVDAPSAAIAAPGPIFCVQLARELAIAQAVAAAATDDTVVVAGKGHETVQIVGKVHHPFDDRVKARAALVARQKG